MFTVSFLKEGITKVGHNEFLLPLSLPALNRSLRSVPWLDRRPAQDFLGGMSRHRAVDREPKCHGRHSYR